MDEEEELRNTLIGQEEEAPDVNTGDVIMGGLPVLAGSTVLTNTTGGLPATTSASAARSASDFDFRLNRAQPSRLTRFGGPGALIYGAADLGLEALTGRGLSERIGEGIAGPLANLFIPGAQSQPAITEAELQRARDNLSTGAQFDIMEEDAEASVAPVTEVTPLEAGLGALNQEIAGRESNIVNNQVELAKQINELGTVSDDQRAAQDFLNERAERSGTTATDVITPFQEQAQLTADLFTDPNTAIGQFVPRATFTLPDGTIIQEDEGGNRRQISAEQLRQFNQDMAGLGQPSVVGLGRGGDAGVIKSFDRPMGVEETRARLQEVAGAPTIREIQEQGAVAPPAAFQDASAEREARLAQRDRLPGESQTERDTRIAQGRTQGSSAESGLSQADLRDIAQGTAKDATEGQRMRALEIQQRAGLGEFKPEQTESQKDFTQRRIALMDAQLAQSGIVPSAPPVVDPETGVITQKYSDDTIRFKGVARSPSGGGFDPNFTGFLPEGEGDKSSDTVKMTDRDGKLRDVPKGDVQEAIKNGYTSVDEDFTPNI